MATNIKSLLPTGAAAQIAKKHGVSRALITNVIRGKSKNIVLLQAVLDEAKKFAEIKKQIEELEKSM